MREWLDGGLNDWDITRDAPYFGIEIPGAKGKYFYVWLDAPIGYLASLKSYLDKKGLDFAKVLADPKLEQIHFIGKDIIYFHTLFWPAMLKFAGRKVPDNVFVHGFLTLTGEKLSKSRGITVSPQKYAELGLNPEWLRYYLAAKLNARVEDLDFNPDDFLARVNSDLVGKYVNIASRAAGFISKRFGGRLSEEPLSAGRELKHKLRGNVAAPVPDNEEQVPGILFEVRSFADQVAADYDARDFGKAIRQVMFLADRVNQYVDEQKPWEIAKEPGQEAALQWFCTLYLELFRILTIYLKPVLPRVAEDVEAFLALAKPLTWEDVTSALKPGHTVQPYRHLLSRIDPKQIEQLLEPLSEAKPEAAKPAAGRGPGIPPGARGAPEARAHPARGRDDLHRRLRQDRPARGAHRRRGAGRRRRQAPQAHAGHRHRDAHRLRRHPLGVHAQGPRGPPHRDGRQPRAAQDALRRIPGHGARRRRRQLDLPPRARIRGDAGHAHQVTPMTDAERFIGRE